MNAHCPGPHPGIVGEVFSISFFGVEVDINLILTGLNLDSLVAMSLNRFKHCISFYLECRFVTSSV